MKIEVTLQVEEDRKLESKREAAQLFEQNAQREIKNEQNYRQVLCNAFYPIDIR